MIVGVTGLFASGKDSMADLLQQKGFAHVSLSDMLRADLTRRGEEVTIPKLTEPGNALRREHGPGVLAQRALEHIDHSRNWVVTSIRTPAEIETLRARPDFILAFVDADRRVRFERSRLRARPGDPETLEQFIAWEERQLNAGNDPAAQSLAACREMANVRFTNEGTVEEFHAQIVEFLQRELFTHFLPRPSWDEYFMMVAEVASTRSNCIKRRVGAVITFEKQILSTGYNGTPKGIKNCCDGGCPRGAAVADSGASLAECIAVHAEENAIIQAAVHGVSIKGGTLYCTLCPCHFCARAIINAGIKEVIYHHGYVSDAMTTRLFDEAGVALRKLEAPAVTVMPRYSPEAFARRTAVVTPIV